MVDKISKCFSGFPFASGSNTAWRETAASNNNPHLFYLSDMNKQFPCHGQEHSQGCWRPVCGS